MLSNRLCLTDEFVLHHGTLPDTGLHSHGALILLLATKSALAIGLQDGTSFCCTSALIDAGVNHRLHSFDEPFVALYVEVHSPLAAYLRQHYLRGRPVVTDVISQGRRQYLANRGLSLADIETLFPRSREYRSSLDSRIHRSLDLIDDALTLPDIAAHSCLSESRFSHLFTQEVGVSFRHYRLWRMARNFMRTLPVHQTFTLHAHEVGFSDASHLSNSFQKLIGLSPRMIVGNYQVVEKHFPG